MHDTPSATAAAPASRDPRVRNSNIDARYFTTAVEMSRACARAARARSGWCRIRRVARFEFKHDPPDEDWLERGDRLLNLVVRGCGLALMGVGLIVSLTVIVSAGALYLSPTHIERFAQAVEQGSHLDLTLSRATAHGQQQLDTSDRAGNSPAPRAPDTTAMTAQPGFRFSYFMAWLIAILLLLLVGRLAIAAVRTGGELALYDVQVKKLARALIKEHALTARDSS